MSERRTTVVTGAASGIGRAVAERLLGEGWRVVGIDLHDDMSAGVIATVGDASDEDVLARASSAAGPRLAGLVCCAGVPPSRSWDDKEAWDEIVRVDLSGPFLAFRVLMPALVAGRGAAVVVGSIVGSEEGSARSPAYAAAKAGLVGLVRSMALVGAPDGVRVNLIEPGAIDTPFDEPRHPADARPDVPLGRMGTPAEVAAAIVFLLSDEAAYMTGATLRIDGGRTISGPR